MASEYGRHFHKVVRNVTMPKAAEEMLLHSEQDGVSKAYLGHLRTTFNRFAAKFPGQILDVTSHEFDTWLRSLNVAATTHNTMARSIKVFFSFAKSRYYLPEDRSTAANPVWLVKDVSDRVSIFTPEQMETILHSAPQRLIPILAIGAFSGIHMAELNRLDWSTTNLERHIIELRATQANTASRRVIPVSDNLAAWLEPLERSGKAVGGYAVTLDDQSRADPAWALTKQPITFGRDFVIPVEAKDPTSATLEGKIEIVTKVAGGRKAMATATSLKLVQREGPLLLQNHRQEMHFAKLRGYDGSGT